MSSKDKRIMETIHSVRDMCVEVKYGSDRRQSYEFTKKPRGATTTPLSKLAEELSLGRSAAQHSLDEFLEKKKSLAP